MVASFSLALSYSSINSFDQQKLTESYYMSGILNKTKSQLNPQIAKYISNATNISAQFMLPSSEVSQSSDCASL